MKRLGIILWLLLLLIIVLGNDSYAIEVMDNTNISKYESDSSRYDFWFNIYSEVYDIPKGLLKAIAVHESGLDENIIGYSGDRGLMQINPEYEQSYLNDMGWEWEFDWHQPRDNIMLGAFILSQNYKYFGDWNKAISAYNTGISGTINNGIRWSYRNKIEWEEEE